MSVIYNKISICHDDVQCYFHVLGDEKKYLDVDSMAASHKELEDYVVSNKFELERDLYRSQELFEKSR